MFSLFIVLIQTPDSPHFYYMLGGNLGSLLYGDVSVMAPKKLNIKYPLSLLNEIQLSKFRHSAVHMSRVART